MMEISIPGKCILAGEHAVVRGHAALALPLRSRALRLYGEKKEERVPFSFQVAPSDWSRALGACLTRVLEAGLAPEGAWEFSVQSSIPAQAGLGSSAALSVAVARFLEASAGLPKERLFPLALELENIFHGTSSGLDVAAVLADAPIYFRKGKDPESVPLSWTPKLFLVDSGLRSPTKACVEKVAALANLELDAKMAEAARLARSALESSERDGLPMLMQAMRSARQCFSTWDLMPAAMEKLSASLEQRGAIAVKPTGSGGGGYLLALWGSPPLPGPEVLVPVF